MTAAASGLQALYRAGDFAGVIRAASDCSPGAPEYAAAMQLSGQASVRLADDANAAICFLRAALNPAMIQSAAQSVCLFNAAVSLRRLGQRAPAKYVLCCDLLLASRRGAHRSSPLLLADWLHDAPDVQRAVLALASALPELRAECMGRLLPLLQRPDSGATMPLPTVRQEIGGVATADSMLSVVVCSHRDAVFARCVSECERAFDGGRFELIRIADAQSMCEGYQRGFQQAKGELLVFMHDDVELLSPEFGSRLRQELEHCDLLAIAGATRFDGPAWFSAGPDFLRGSVSVPRSDGRYDLYWASLGVERMPLAVADGFFLACHRRVVDTIRWDAYPIPGFHGYDIDFTCRASRAGFKAHAAVSLQVAHASEGVFDDRWLDASKAVCARLGVGPGPAAAPRWVSTVADSRAEAALQFDRVVACVNSAPGDVHALLRSLEAGSGDASLQDNGEITQLLQALSGVTGAASTGSMDVQQSGTRAPTTRV